MKGRNTALVLVIIIIVLGVFAWEYRDSAWLAPLLGSYSAKTSQSQIGKTAYACDAGKTITATYYQGAAAASAGTSTPLAPNGSVALVLSDGRSLTLPQTIAASGIRYGAADNSMVFWSKGNTAFVTEGNENSQTFANCIATSNIEGQQSWSTLASSTLGYSVRYPQGYALNTSYAYQQLGPGKTIYGTQLTIPESMATGTNLASDTYLSIETLPKAASCTADRFLGSQIVGSTTQLLDNGTTYSMAKSAGAGAGNLYEEYVYAIEGSSPCRAVRYLAHSSQLGNYPAGTVKAFDRQALLSEFDGIRRSLVLAK